MDKVLTKEKERKGIFWAGIFLIFISLILLYIYYQIDSNIFIKIFGFAFLFLGIFIILTASIEFILEKNFLL